MDFDIKNMPPKDAYKLLIGIIVPRPIALVTTISADGTVNAAPFSFFNILANDPAIVAFGVERRGNKSPKDTAANIAENGEFVVHIVDDALAERMNICAIDFPPEIDELAHANLTTKPSLTVKPPTIVEAPAALECKRVVGLELGHRAIILGEVLALRVRDDIVDPAKLYVNSAKLDAVGRLAGNDYVRTRDRFALAKVTPAEFAAGKTVEREPA